MHFNPLSLNSDQHQISPSNINAYSTPEVMRIRDMITTVNFVGILITSPQYFCNRGLIEFFQNVAYQRTQGHPSGFI